MKQNRFGSEWWVQGVGAIAMLWLGLASSGRTVAGLGFSGVCSNFDEDYAACAYYACREKADDDR
jgi:hypothetical protein